LTANFVISRRWMLLVVVAAAFAATDWGLRTAEFGLTRWADNPESQNPQSAIRSPNSEVRNPKPLERFEFTRLHMGTIVRIVLYAPDGATAREAADAAYERIEELEAILSHFREDSEVSRLVREGYQAPFGASPELYTVLSKSRGFSELTQGAFDVTVGPLAELWRQARLRKALPAVSDIERARKSVGYSKIRLESNHTVRLERPDMRIDLSAIAKGFIADQALKVLNERGVASALLDAGGDIVTSKPPPGRPGWSIQVRHFKGSAPGDGIISLAGRAIASSGEEFQFLEIDGIRYSHILDPETGMGLRRSMSTTVIAAEGTTADALATGFSVLAPEEALRLAESLPGVEAFLVLRSAEGVQSFQSSGFPP
jgi:FAD:protein FMN transferase